MVIYVIKITAYQDTKEGMKQLTAVKGEQKIYGLDTLRGIGITGIVLYHLFPGFIKGGFLGVPLFFVLSGYLMFLTAVKSWEKGEFHITRYYKKRIFKIYPALFFMVMAVCCYFTLFQRENLAGIRREICSIFFGYNNWWQIHENTSYFTKFNSPSYFKHLWFLSVEMQLYLLWPFIFFAYQKGCHYLGKKKMAFCFLGLAILSAGRMFWLYTPGADPSRVYYGTDTIAFSVCLGIFLGAITQEKKKKEVSLKAGKNLFYLCLFLTLVLFVFVDGQNAILYQGGMFLCSLMFMIMAYLIGNPQIGIGKKAEKLWFSKAGKWSYFIYLWHYPLIEIVKHVFF